MIKKRIFLLSSMLSSLLLQGCFNSYSYEFLTTEDTVLVIGDNFASGYGVSERFSFPNVLSRSINRKVINASRSGSTTSDILNLAEPYMSDPSIKLIILVSGFNDYTRGIEARLIYANYLEFFQKARRQGIPVLFVTFADSRHQSF